MFAILEGELLNGMRGRICIGSEMEALHGTQEPLFAFKGVVLRFGDSIGV